MFFIMYLPLLGEFHLQRLTLFNLVVATIKGWVINKSSNELTRSSEAIKLTQSIAPVRRKNLIPWQRAIWGFRL